MTILGITGGIAAGKSFVCTLLEERGIPVFNCDAVAKELMVSDTEVAEGLKGLLGEQVYLENKTINKALIAEYILQKGAEAVNAIVHPAVRKAFGAWCERHKEASFVAMESAILFEAHFEDTVDVIVFVKAPVAVKIQRLKARNHLTEEQAKAWIAVQLEDEEKEKRSDFVILNDGISDLQIQIDTLLKKHFLGK